MTKYAWCSDVHLDHLSTEDQIVQFAEKLVIDHPNGIFITGDISNAKQLVYHLSVLERVVQRPIYYVLGNHDFYGGDIEGVRKTMLELGGLSPFLKYMPATSYVGLSQATAVIGADGWYDAQFGDWQKSRFMMNDWQAIRDFVPHSGGSNMMARGMLASKGDIVTLCRKLAHEGVMHIQAGIKGAARYHKELVILSHVPPFQDAHIFQGKIGDSNAQPWFTNKLLGDMLMDASRTYPNVNFTVLCGHTHGKADIEYTKNLRIHVAGAEYGQPSLASMIELV